MTAATVEARWRCADCGGFVAGATVQLLGAAKRPTGDCDRCRQPQAPVLYERLTGGDHTTDRRPVGADASLLDFAVVARESFLDVITRMPAGARFSVNNVRSRLDALDVPAALRGRLFEMAVELGMLRPLYVEAGGFRVAAREPSTGASANGATVRIYERTGPTS